MIDITFPRPFSAPLNLDMWARFSRLQPCKSTHYYCVGEDKSQTDVGTTHVPDVSQKLLIHLLKNANRRLYWLTSVSVLLTLPCGNGHSHRYLHVHDSGSPTKQRRRTNCTCNPRLSHTLAAGASAASSGASCFRTERGSSGKDRTTGFERSRSRRH